MKSKEKKSRGWLFLPLMGLLIGGIGWLVFTCFEGSTPVISMDLVSDSIGEKEALSLEVKDKGRGVKEVQVSFYKDGRDHVLEQKSFPASSFLGATGVDHVRMDFAFKPSELGISDGVGTLRVRVRDASLRGGFKGNVAYLEREIRVDTRPPEIRVVTRRHYLAQGGAGLVGYRLSEPVVRSGVKVDGNFFPGYGGFGPNKDVYLAFFGLHHEPGSGSEIFIVAEDFAGNKGRAGFPHHVNARRFPEDKINISDRFLNWKMPEFQIPGGDPDSPLEKFLKVNNLLRDKNEKVIFAATEKSESAVLWDRHFLPLPAAANRGGFADRRIYYHNGREIDRQFHMGLDLASIAQSPVPAAASGKVVMTETVGIYGRNVILDHGCGLFTHYAHMSQIDVAVGDRVKRGDTLGLTGLTGMAGGDHLHFGVIVHNTFVNPIEWLDANWVENNILSKLRDIEAGI
ncbi:M23 family metallopeptidase [Desulfobotulus mexicanus]|uniref:M23 family metallopeptidase n=1 Tax=Desulfobotulus mexicanus TaxID=2586642 RepID=A0A5Q4VG09_9BACT|nr:M23 family metallopeptidase [Desulfobotulus mexicanus]TYT75888.1 M23 family metallopeptidase [Desulfobotulus mexicanus]